MQKNKTIATVFIILLVSSMALALSQVPTTKGEIINGVNYNDDTAKAIKAGMTWDINYNASSDRLLLWSRFGDKIPTYCYIMVAPSPVGVGQKFNVVMFNPQVPPDALLINDIRYMYQLKITKPDGTVESLPPSGTSSGNVAQGGSSGGYFISDSTGSTYTAFTPNVSGNYTLTCYFQELKYRWNSSNTQRNFYGTTFLASNYTTIVTVQDEPVAPIGLPALEPIPTEYWTRPIEGQNTAWFTVSSNWLCNAHDRDNGGNENRFQPDGIAPNSSHILWTRPTEDNGIVGGTYDGRNGGNAFNAGSQYQPRFNTQIIMYGRLYYTPNTIYQGTSELLDCVDLKTGKLLWETNTTETTGGSNVPSFGYYYSEDNPNEHGIANPGWLFTSNYRVGYQPERGFPQIRISNVPNGFELQGKTGENIRYVLTNKGNSSNPSYYLSEWNSSLVIPTRFGASGTIDGGTTSSVEWNVTSPIQFSTSPSVRAGIIGNMIWGSNGSWPTGTSGPNYAYPDEVTIWAISVDPANPGKLLYMKNLDIDDGAKNTNNMFERADANSGVFVTLEVPVCKFHVYDITTGNEMFVTDAQSDDLNPYGYFTWPSLISATQTKLAYGMLYTAGYTGSVSAYNLTTGQLQWRRTYSSGAEKINNYVQMEGLIADGKIYVGTHEHSADTPLYKGEQVHALDAFTGETVWDLAGWAYPMTFATADGVLIYWNNYDAQIYAIGKGPTSMTVSAPDAATPIGTSITIKGTVMDISAGVNQNEQSKRFPNGLAAVSEGSMKSWMEYVYMQKARPTNATGVPVTLSVVDGNGNYREIGQTTSDADGFFSLNWKPDIEGKYTVYASFAGSEGYWPSHAVTAFSVDAAAPTQAPAATPIASMTDAYFLPAVIGIIVAIVIVGVVLALLVRKRP